MPGVMQSKVVQCAAVQSAAEWLPPLVAEDRLSMAVSCSRWWFGGLHCDHCDGLLTGWSAGQEDLQRSAWLADRSNLACPWQQWLASSGSFSCIAHCRGCVWQQQWQQLSSACVMWIVFGWSSCCRFVTSCVWCCGSCGSCMRVVCWWLRCSSMTAAMQDDGSLHLKRRNHHHDQFPSLDSRHFWQQPVLSAAAA